MSKFGWKTWLAGIVWVALGVLWAWHAAHSYQPIVVSERSRPVQTSVRKKPALSAQPSVATGPHLPSGPQHPPSQPMPPVAPPPTTVVSASENMYQSGSAILQVLRHFNGPAGSIQIIAPDVQAIQSDYAVLARLHAGSTMMRAAKGIQFSANLIMNGLPQLPPVFSGSINTPGDTGIGIEGFTVRLPELLAAIKPLDPAFKP